MANKWCHVQILLSVETWGSHIGLLIQGCWSSSEFSREIVTSGGVSDDAGGWELFENREYSASELQWNAPFEKNCPETETAGQISSETCSLVLLVCCLTFQIKSLIGASVLLIVLWCSLNSVLLQFFQTGFGFECVYTSPHSQVFTVTFSNALPCVGRQTVSSLSFRIATVSSRAPTLDQETASNSSPSGHMRSVTEKLFCGCWEDGWETRHQVLKSWPHVAETTGDLIWMVRRCCHYTLVLSVAL